VLDVAAASVCRRCALHETRQRVVIGAGPLDARLLVVGEAPGRREDEGGEPFIGRSGQLLTRLIAEELGLGREEYYITNVVKCRPPNNRPPSRLEREACRPWLEEQLRSQNPAVILCAGATAARAVLGSSSPVGTLHGQIFTVFGASALATYHPAAALRGGSNVERVMRADLVLVKELLGR
jgi:DNA polymerase